VVSELTFCILFKQSIYVIRAFFGILRHVKSQNSADLIYTAAEASNI